MIKQLQNRNKLQEGRSYGLGYSILKKVNKNDYETYLAFTACKDYLNDLVYIENTGLNITTAIHGYSHTYQEIFKNKRYFYLGVCAIDRKSGGGWNKYKECQKLISSNLKYILFHINKLEEYFNFGKSRTSIVDFQEIENYNNKAIIFRVPIYWVKNPILISLYTLFIRITFNINKNLSFEELLQQKVYISSDEYLKNDFVKILDINVSKLKKYLNLYTYDLNVKSLSNIHNYGIKSWINKIINFENNIRRCW